MSDKMSDNMSDTPTPYQDPASSLPSPLMMKIYHTSVFILLVVVTSTIAWLLDKRDMAVLTDWTTETTFIGDVARAVVIEENKAFREDVYKQLQRAKTDYREAGISSEQIEKEFARLDKRAEELMGTISTQPDRKEFELLSDLIVQKSLNLSNLDDRSARLRTDLNKLFINEETSYCKAGDSRVETLERFLLKYINNPEDLKNRENVKKYLESIQAQGNE